MNAYEILRANADRSYRELLESLDGVSQATAWGCLEWQPGQYMHSEGSILSELAHVASCKFLFGSAAFRGLEIRWRDTIRDLEGYWTDWEAAMAYLHRSHEYWMGCWSEATDLEALVTSHTGRQVPAWQHISAGSFHDAYHGGQIQLMRAMVVPSETPPPDEAALWREYCESSPSW